MAAVLINASGQRSRQLIINRAGALANSLKYMKTARIL